MSEPHSASATTVSNILTVPNVLTIMRVMLIPVIVYVLIEERWSAAMWLFAISALSDLLDGFIARRFNQMSEFGAMLDPIADKLTMLAMVLVLGWEAMLPLWLAAAIVVRDIVIVSGAVAYRVVTGRLEMEPTLLSKINTVLEFLLVGMVLTGAAGLVDFAPVLLPSFLLVFATVALSGIQYVWMWALKAARGGPRAS